MFVVTTQKITDKYAKLAKYSKTPNLGSYPSLAELSKLIVLKHFLYFSKYKATALLTILESSLSNKYLNIGLTI